MNKKEVILNVISYIFMGLAILWGIILFVASYVAAISTIIISIIFLSPHIRRYLFKNTRSRRILTFVIFPILYVIITYTAMLHSELDKYNNISGFTQKKDNSELKNELKSEYSDNSNEINSSKSSQNISDIFDVLRYNSSEEKEIYVTDQITVGKDGDIKAGIYDMKVIGGSGNIIAKGNFGNTMYLNWIGYSENNNMESYASNFRVILLEGDVIEYKGISKVRFTPIKEFIKDNKLYSGVFTVGNDIKPGKYKLSTNAKLDNKYELGWKIDIYNDIKRKTKSQTFTYKNNDVVINLEDGDIIFTNFYNTDKEFNSDDARLIFEKVN